MDSFQVLYTPEQIRQLPEWDLTGHVAVVIDVLRATSVMITALAHGAEAIFPIQTIEEALALKQSDPAALLAGERDSLPPPGFDLGNSPLEFTAQKINGKRLYHTTTNGTQAFAAARQCPTVIAAGFLNFSAVVRFLQKQNSSTLIICSGTVADYSQEDGLLAGAIANELQPEHPAASIYRAMAGSLEDNLRRTRNGRRLVSIGKETDVQWCAQCDWTAIVPQRQPDGWIRV
jgi:2-phosphosulfolactate phosphatase